MELVLLYNILAARKMSRFTNHLRSFWVLNPGNKLMVPTATWLVICEKKSS